MDPYVVDDLEDDAAGLRSLIVRTDFADEAAWTRLQAALMVAGTTEPDLDPPFTFVDNPRFDGLSSDQFVSEVARRGLYSNHLFLADDRAQHEDDHTLEVVSFWDDGSGDEGVGVGRTFRVKADEVAAVGVNLTLANMDFFEFADVADAAADGVFRGFAE